MQDDGGTGEPPRMLQVLCQYITYPLWDLKDGTGRLRELRSLRKSQYWTTTQLRDLQLRRVQAMVAHAFRHCSFYREYWQSEPRIQRLEDLRGLPLVTKSHVADHTDGFIAAPYPREALVAAKTGGSTGVALRVYFDEACQKARNAAAMRTDGWAGWRPGLPTGALWGSPPIPRTLKEKIRNSLHDRLFYLDTMRLDANSMGEFIRELNRRAPGVLFGHAHSLYIFAKFVRDSAAVMPEVKGIVATSMMLLENERRVIQQVFGCPVTNRYGCEEVGLIASECEVHHGMHLNSEHVMVEFVADDGTPVKPGEEGNIVVTDLMNHGMPLVRYRVGDMGVPSTRMCECGRGLPLMERLTGRSADFLRRRDGSMVAGISLVEKTLTAVPGIEQLQIVQNQLDEFVLNLVAAPDYTEASGVQLQQAILDAFGSDVRVELRPVESLAQERNSKYRFSICRV